MRQARKSGNNSACLLISLIALALVAVGLVPSYARANGPAQSQEDMDHLSTLSGKDFEIDFMSMMIQHHRSAVEMVKLVPDRASHAEIKQVASNIINDQVREIGEMTSWLKQWYSTAPRTGQTHDMPGNDIGAGDVIVLRGLRGDDFDKEFLTIMRLHHMSAVEMARLVPSRATHSELKTLAKNIISSQSAEIQEFEGWLKAWYGIDVTGGAATPVDPLPGEGMSGGTAPGMPSTGSGQGSIVTPALLLAALAVAGMLLIGGVRFREVGAPIRLYRSNPERGK